MALRTINRIKYLPNNIVRNYTSETKLVSVEVNDKSGVATLTLQRPPVNSLNLELISELSTTLDNLEKTKCRGAIITSASKSVFSAGLDILEMYKPESDRVKKFWIALQDFWIKLYGSAFPTVAVINGHAPAGGCLVSVSCEYRIMLNNFTIGLNETKLGIVAPHWFIDSMKNVVGHRQAEGALTLGKLFTTDEAFKIGLVDEVVSTKEEGIVKAEQFLAQFMKISPVARSLTKKLVREETLTNMIKNREKDLNVFLSFVNKEDTQKGLGLYLEALKKKSSN